VSTITPSGVRAVPEELAARAPAGSTADIALRELVAVREIVHAFLTAERPEDVYRLALERVTTIVGASFASVYLVDDDGESMRLAASHNWPARWAPWLDRMRVRMGSGPSGEAAQSGRPVEVPDVFADESLADWQEVATELQVRSIIALPLLTADRTLGAVTFYFDDAGAFGPNQLGLLRVVADHLAATAERASLMAQLQTTNAALTESHAALERQYTEVIEARRVKDEFLANISHELRTPLTAVMGYSQIMLEGISGPLTDEQRGDLAQVRSASDRLLALIDDLLELTTLKRGAIAAELMEFDPREPLKDALRIAGDAPTGVALDVEMPNGPLPRMRSDRRKVVKILTGLLNNAYKFTTHGDVSASASVANDVVTYSVRDTGMGIADHALPVVFDEFRQADGSLTRRHGGSGLGLALSRRLARMLGGDVEVESRVGVGSTFVVHLPLEAPVSASGPLSPHDQPRA
jgi:signal transduction histidine kinase